MQVEITDAMRLEGLRDAILADPLNDGLRGMYADVCEQSGDCARAEFVKVQIELAATACEPPCPGNHHAAGGFDTHCICYRIALSYRQRELLERHSREWLPELPGHVKNHFASGQLGYSPPHGARVEVRFRRGFIDEIRLTAAQFVGKTCPRCNGDGYTTAEVQVYIERETCIHCKGTGRIPGFAKQLFSAAPITSVVLDRKPLRWRPDSGSGSQDWPERFLWINEGAQRGERGVGGATRQQAMIPEPLFKVLAAMNAETLFNEYVRFDAEAAAQLSLSRACVAFGRETAGLPPLVWPGATGAALRSEPSGANYASAVVAQGALTGRGGIQ